MEEDEELQALRAAAIRSMMTKKSDAEARVAPPATGGVALQRRPGDPMEGGQRMVRPPLQPPPQLPSYSYPHQNRYPAFQPPMMPYAVPFYGDQQLLLHPYPPFNGHPRPAFAASALPVPRRFTVHRHPPRHAYRHASHSFLHSPPHFAYHYTKGPPRDPPSRLPCPPAAPAVVKESTPSPEQEKRLPGRFSRIDRSDSESEEDDRLDEFIDSDDARQDDASEPEDRSPRHQQHSPPVIADPKEATDGKQSSSQADVEEAAAAAEVADAADASDALSDLEVPDTDAITFEEEEDDLESSLQRILADEQQGTEVPLPKVLSQSDCKSAFAADVTRSPARESAAEERLQPSQPPRCPENNREESSDSKAAAVAVASVERKTIRLRETATQEDALERRKRKFGVESSASRVSPVKEGGAAVEEQGSREAGSSRHGKRIRSCVVLRKP